jgi:hypothetical protein
VRDSIDKFNKATKQKLVPFYERLPPRAVSADVAVPVEEEQDLLTNFSVHTAEEALIEIRARYLDPADAEMQVLDDAIAELTEHHLRGGTPALERGGTPALEQRGGTPALEDRQVGVV